MPFPAIAGAVANALPLLGSILPGGQQGQGNGNGLPLTPPGLQILNAVLNKVGG
jgi:hypothetical protein